MRIIGFTIRLHCRGALAGRESQGEEIAHERLCIFHNL